MLAYLLDMWLRRNIRCAHVSLRRNFANGSFSRILRTNCLALHPLATISSAFP